TSARRNPNCCATYLILSVFWALTGRGIRLPDNPAGRAPRVPRGRPSIRQRPGFRAILRPSPAPRLLLGSPRSRAEGDTSRGRSERGLCLSSAVAWLAGEAKPPRGRWPSFRGEGRKDRGTARVAGGRGRWGRGDLARTPLLLSG